MASLLPIGMDRGAAVALAARHSVFGDPADDSALARDGALSFLPVLRSTRHSAVFYSCANTDRNPGRGDSDQGSDPVASRAVRYWNRRADRGLCGCSFNPCRGNEFVETACARYWTVSIEAGISGNLLCNTQPAARISAWARRCGTAFEPRVSASDSGCGMGRNVRDRSQSAAQRATGWGAYCLRHRAARASRHLLDHGGRPCLPGTLQRGVVYVGGADYADERVHLPSTASAGFSYASCQPLGPRFARSGHAGAHLHDLANPSQLK